MKKEDVGASPSHRRAIEPPSPKGRARSQEILAAAKCVLIEKDYTQFSLRNVAARAGMHLANLQYYFPSREVLIRALVAYVTGEYEARYAERFAKLPALPRARLVAMLDYLIEDIHDACTRRFFIQLWALLESADPGGGGLLLRDLYTRHIDNVAVYVGELNPALSPGARRLRAAMIAATIEGMMLMLADAERLRVPGEPDIATQMREQLLRMATEP